MKEFGFLKKYIKPHIPKFIIAGMCMLGFALTTMLSSWIVKPTLDEVFIKKDMTKFYMILVAIPLIYLAKGVFWYFQWFLTTYIGEDIAKKIRNECFEHLQLLSLDYHHRISTGKNIGIITDQVTSLQFTISQIPLTLISDGFTFIAVLGLLFYLNWRLTFVSLIILPFATYAILNFSRRFKLLAEKIQSQTLHLFSKLQEKLSGMMIIKLFNKEQMEIQDFSNVNSLLFTLKMKLTKYTSLSSPVMEFLGACGMVLLLYIGAREVFADKWTTGAFFAFIVAIISFYRPLRNFTQLNSHIQMARTAVKNILDIFSTNPSIHEKNNLENITEFKSEIRFENVTFIYPNTKFPVLKNLSFTIKKGQSIGILGPSGAGKTSLMYLLLKFFIPTSGDIYIDGKSIKNISAESIRKLIGVVPQDIFLFNSTVYDNIVYGANTDEEDVIKMAEIANAHDFIMKLPNGYQTIVGERGAQLSGGQKQRIAIARALIKKPSILILDEATSALDAESERLIQEALQKLMKFMTIIIITHRLATVKNLDFLIVIDDGKVIEKGTHEDLFKLNGLYRRFHRLQFI